MAAAAFFHQAATPCVLDMHNVLWQSYARQLECRRVLPDWWKRRSVARYRLHEEHAWREFDGLIAINGEEETYARSVVSEGIPVFYAPMGTDLTLWPHCWRPARPPRLAYYGGLGSPHNQADARRCYTDIMPRIWREAPDAQFWVVGGKPPPSVQSFAQDQRVRVTGYVPRVQDTMKTMTAVLCPWSGTYGFRSRLVEVMALGVPVVASPQAVYGMEMESGRGIFLEQTDGGMADAALRLIRDHRFATEQSRCARRQMEDKFSYEATYGRLARELSRFARSHAAERGPDGQTT